MLKMSSIGTALLKLLTFGLYGRGKSSKDIERYRKDGKLKVKKSIDRDGVGAIAQPEFIEKLKDFNND